MVRIGLAVFGFSFTLFVLDGPYLFTIVKRLGQLGLILPWICLQWFVW